MGGMKKRIERRKADQLVDGPAYDPAGLVGAAGLAAGLAACKRENVSPDKRELKRKLSKTFLKPSKESPIKQRVGRRRKTIGKNRQLESWQE